MHTAIAIIRNFLINPIPTKGTAALNSISILSHSVPNLVNNSGVYKCFRYRLRNIKMHNTKPTE